MRPRAEKYKTHNTKRRKREEHMTYKVKNSSAYEPAMAQKTRQKNMLVPETALAAHEHRHFSPHFYTTLPFYEETSAR